MAIVNAGTSATGPFEDMPVASLLRVVTINAESAMIMAAALVRAEVLSSHLCFVSSLSHFTGYPGAAAYAASKDALAIYARSVRKPWGRKGITVTVACPGPLATPQAERHAPQGADPAKRIAPEAAALAILAGTLAGNALVIPGAGPKLFALAGKLFPRFVTGQMKRLIYDRLGEPRW
jgi:short-subunit dehydrogenase